MQNILDDPNDLKPSRLRPASSETQAAAYGILTGPVTASCGLIDNECSRGALPVALREFSTLQQRYAHCPKIVYAHDTTISAWSVGVGFSRMTFDGKRTTSVNTAQREIVDGTDRLHAVQSLNALPRLLIERGPLLRRILGLGKDRPHG